jgi:hypothetical protein
MDEILRISAACVAEVSREGAKTLRFETKIRTFAVSFLFAPSRLGEKNNR